MVATLYLGYCYGWWLRNNLLVQRVLQCNCPAESEAVRYAPFRLVVSACVDPRAHVSPSGAQFLLFEAVPARVSIRAADMSLVRDLPPTEQDVFFLTDTLVVGGQQAYAQYVVRLDTPGYTPVPLVRRLEWDPSVIPRDVSVQVYRDLPAPAPFYVIGPDDLAQSVLPVKAARNPSYARGDL